MFNLPYNRAIKVLRYKNWIKTLEFSENLQTLEYTNRKKKHCIDNIIFLRYFSVELWMKKEPNILCLWKNSFSVVISLVCLLSSWQIVCFPWRNLRLWKCEVYLSICRKFPESFGIFWDICIWFCQAVLVL